MIYILSLRLYWLRQTADYEFDFEVKTSLRELSITLKTVMDFIELQLFSRSEEENFFEKNDEGKSVTNVENIDINNNPVKEFDYISYYNVKVNFPLNDFLIEKPILYISAVHLNTSFTKEYIFSVLNFMDGITNKGKYFKYHTYNDFSLPLNLHIDDEGRWTVWFSIKEINGLGYILYNDLITKFEDFINNFNNRIYELKNILYIKLISSNPLLEDGDLNSFSINGMSGLKNGLLDRKNLLEYLITDQVSKELTLKKNNPNTLELNSKWNIRLNISIDDFEQLGNLPLRYMLVQELSKNEKKLYI